MVKCQCTEMDSIYTLFENGKKTVIVCGFLDEEQDCSEKLVSGLLIKDCKNDKILFDYSNDEISKHIVSKAGQKIKIFTTILLLKGNDWEYELSKETEQLLFFENEKVKLSERKNIFVSPILTKSQKKDLTKICKSLNDILNENDKPNYPYDEKSIYMLNMGFLAGNVECKNVLESLRKSFTIDGAIAESLSEIGF